MPPIPCPAEQHADRMARVSADVPSYPWVSGLCSAVFSRSRDSAVGQFNNICRDGDHRLQKRRGSVAAVARIAIAARNGDVGEWLCRAELRQICSGFLGREYKPIGREGEELIRSPINPQTGNALMATPNAI